MGLEQELQAVKREQELAQQAVKREQEQARQAAQEAEQKTQTHRSKLRQAILSQRQSLVAHWTKTVSALLGQLGKSTWGEGAYTLIEPNVSSSLSWFVVHVEGKTKSNYEVILLTDEASVDDLSLSPEDTLVRPVCFAVAGAQKLTCTLSQECLEEAMVSTYRGGAKGNGLDQWAEAILAKSRYKKGEYDDTNYWILLSTLFTLLTGVIGLGMALFVMIPIVSAPQLVEPDSLLSVIAIIALLTLFGLGMIALSIVAFWRTSLGKRFHRLPTVEKVLAVIAAIPGAMTAVIMSAGLIVVVIGVVLLLAGAAAGASGAATDADRKERVSEIEEGVRRALK